MGESLITNYGIINLNDKKIMFQGTGSDVGKSMVVAGFCRALKKTKYVAGSV